MNEKIFQQEIRNSIKFFYPGCHYQKIPDPYKKFEDISRRPYDAFCLDNNNFFAFEYKQMKNPESFPFKNVQDHQVYNLANVMANLNPAYILINYRFIFSEKQMQKYGATQNKYNFIVAFRIDWYITIKTILQDMLNIKSISFEKYIWPIYQQKNNMLIEWIKHKDNWMWDMRKLLK
jgi:penicillin-binding protein-related factor A (putative recombinase)